MTPAAALGQLVNLVVDVVDTDGALRWHIHTEHARRLGMHPTPYTTHDGRPLRSHVEHGTRTCYVIDKCRCARCGEAHREYEKARSRRIEPAYVGADPARQHIAMLAENGVGLKTIAKRSGVSHGALWKIVYGKPGRGPSKRIRKGTLDRILAVTPADGAAGSRVPAGPLLELVEEMVAAGVPKKRIAEELGQTGPGLQLGSQLITRRHAQAIRDLHARWTAGDVVLTRRSRHGEREIPPPPPVEPTSAELVEDHLNRDRVLLRLVELLEDRIDQRSWSSQAACSGRPTWMWFPARGDHQTTRAALKICKSCLVRDECLEANLDRPDGIFGATAARQRRILLRERETTAA